MNIGKPKISVIVPVYNTCNYLKRCIDSIISSRNSNWEIILVDDGSTDGSSEICDYYAGKFQNIKALHIPNGGVSRARNYGIKFCTGEWICFIDSDDYIDNDFLTIGDFYDCDVIRKSYNIVDENGVIRKGYQNTNNLILSNSNEIYRYYLSRNNFALWDLIIRSDIVKGNTFKESISIGEDMLFFLDCICDIKKYALSADGSYFYCIRNTSLMHSNNSIRRRIDICFSNVDNLLSSDLITKNKYFCEAIIAKISLMELFSYRKYLSNKEKVKLKKLFNLIEIKALSFLDVFKVFKFIVKKILINLL